MESIRYHNKRLLRCGYTTGSCAAAAAKAAVTALLTGKAVETVTVMTPAGIPLTLEISEFELSSARARCAVKKDGGDDPDVTDGVLVYAEVNRTGGGIAIDGGDGVGRVTKPGLDQPVGAAAINSVPRAMIAREIAEACAAAGYAGGISAVISIPGGQLLASRTFNPRMGIAGGLSILGTSGIVEPMSSKALADTLKLELNILAAAGHRSVLLTIGNIGGDFTREVLALNTAAHVKTSNFLGDALDAAVLTGFARILVAGHIGKLVKLGIGMTNTHSSNGDGRMETLTACALHAGAGLETLRELAECVTTDAALGILHRSGYLGDTMAELGRRIGDTLKRRMPDTVEIGFLCFSGSEILVQSENAKELKKWFIS